MNTRTMVLMALGLFLCASAEAQTKRIAHKSHSGSAASFRIDGPDNFGLGPMQGRTDTVETKKTVPKKPLPKNLPAPKPKPAPLPSPNYPAALPELPADTTKKK